MSVKIWDCNTQSIVNSFEHHSEFVTGLDFNLFNEGQIATAGWDGLTSVFNIKENKMRIQEIRRGMDANNL